MNGSRENIKKMKKLRKSRTSKTAQEPQITSSLPQRVFLYLHLKSLTYPANDIPLSGRLEIEIEHQFNKITKLSDHFMERNVIEVDQLEFRKPTFSVTIEQDNLEDITNLSDAPIMLTLYQYTTPQLTEEISPEEAVEESLERIPIAQGYIDIMEYFNKKRCHSIDTIYLYPLKTYAETNTWKTVWEIYSLHPLLKTVAFTNVLFINFGSLYNINEDLMQDCNDLVAKLSLVSKTPQENNLFHKIFICKFTKFNKNIISSQNLSKKWESLKSTHKDIENWNSMGIATDSKFHLHHLFTNILCSENSPLNIGNINITEDFALICNSLHRYILTDMMQKTLEQLLSQNQYQIIVELFREREENVILLEGYIDLSIFMYPEVRFCPFAIELTPPTVQVPHNNNNNNKDSVKNIKGKRKSQTKSNSQESKIQENKKIPFAIIQICLNSPITNPIQEMNHPTRHKSKRHKYSHCTTTILTKISQKDLNVKSQENYRAFDELIREILNYMIENNITTLGEDKEYFCHQLGNLTNKIMKLIAGDFNRRVTTKTNIEFTNLLTQVFHELTSRINGYLNKCNTNDLNNCLLSTVAIENSTKTEMSMAKYLYEVGGNSAEIADFIIDKLRSANADNLILDFYIFLYDIERENFNSAKAYLNKSLDEKVDQAELFAELILIYVNYKLQLQDSENSSTAEEFLIKALMEHMQHNPKSLTGWILLYRIYKKYNYQPGMAYCRWKYENLYERVFVKLEFLPQSRWEIYMPYKINLKSLKGENYLKVFDTLIRLGLYDFAEWVFDEIAQECLEIERYFVSSTFRILNKEQKISIKTFPVDKLENSLQLNSMLALVNGNLEHLQIANSPAAIKQYQKLTEIEDLKDLKLYQLGLLRYAYKMMEDHKYEEASQIFLNFCKQNINCKMAATERGKCCYYLGQLEEAEKCFALSTQYGMYMPNNWAYLALINLKLGNNYNALECWKYARLNQNTEIAEEILNELNEINISDVFLYVDVPNKI